MDLEIIEDQFFSYLKKFWKLSEITPFLRAYIRLLLLLKNELSEVELDGVLKRQRQLHGEKFEGADFEELRKSCETKRSGYLKNNANDTREAILNNLLRCAFLDKEENHFFYLAEPMFEFVEEMQISAIQLKEILESEFVGFRI